MTTASLRKKLKSFIETANDKKIKGLYLLVEEEIEKSSYLLSEEQMALVEEERVLHIKGLSKSYFWPSAKKAIRSKK